MGIGLKNQPVESKAQLSHQADGLVPVTPSIPPLGFRRPSAAINNLHPLPGPRECRHATLPNTLTELGSQLPSSSFPRSVQIKATALYPSFVNSICVWSSPGLWVVCSWTAFWKAFLCPHWASAMGLEELQAHRMPQRERNVRQEGNNIKLACPVHMVAKLDSTRPSFASEILCHWAEKNRSKAHSFIGWDNRMRLDLFLSFPHKFYSATMQWWLL